MTKDWEQRFDTFIDTLPNYVNDTPRSVFKEFTRTEIENARKEERERIVKELQEYNKEAKKRQPPERLYFSEAIDVIKSLNQK